MALISDPDFLIHNIRLTYLRHVEDVYGPRIISFSPRHTANAHVVAAGLADSDRWPEIRASVSPSVSEDEDGENGGRPHNGFPGARGLKYTQTIVGPNRVGALGMRVSGKRSATSKLTLATPKANDPAAKRARADSEPTPLSAVPKSPSVENLPGSPDTFDGPIAPAAKMAGAAGSSLNEIPTSGLAADEVKLEPQPPIARSPVALHSFSRIAAIQARRQRRRAHFTSAAGGAARPIIVEETSFNPELSSEDEDQGGPEPGDEHTFEQIEEGEEGGDVEADEFDPEYAALRNDVTSDSDVNSPTSNSNSGVSLISSSAFNQPNLSISRSLRAGTKLSPVNESGHGSKSTSEDASSRSRSVAPEANKSTQPNQRISAVKPDRAHSQHRAQMKQDTFPAMITENQLFSRRKIQPVRYMESALTAKLASTNTSSNPFTELYALISGRAEVASMTITVYFPHCKSPQRPLKLNVRKDASIEEVVGFALWSYWEEGWEPKLDDGFEDADEMKRKVRFSAAGWVLRIAEEDGEIDEDWPAPDRMGKISKFFFEAYAIVEATPAQVLQNQQLELKIVRRPSRIIVVKKTDPISHGPAPSIGPATSSLSASALASSLGISTSLSSSHGPQVLLRIRVADVADAAIHYSTTISVSATMYMQEVLEHVCRKRKLADPKEWALLSDDFKILVPLDRTVAGLGGNSELVLVKRVTLPQYGFPVDGDRRTNRTTDPNAPIFGRPVSEITMADNSDKGLIARYKRFTVYRKVPMFVARLERTLAIDGDYIHIMPSANKARGVFDSGKTVSYHIKSVVSCTQSSKSSSSFKIIFRRESGDKRYDFDAENPKLASEIVNRIRGLKTLKSGLDRSTTVTKSRRSRHVV